MKTKTQYKEYINKVIDKYSKDMKYKRIIFNTKDCLIFEVYNNEKTIFNTFMLFDLQSYNTRNNTCVYTVNKKDIDYAMQKGYYIN